MTALSYCRINSYFKFTLVDPRRLVNRGFFENEKWPLLLTDKVATAGFPPTEAIAAPLRATRAADGARPQTHTQMLLPSAPEWRFLRGYREGNDIVIPQAVATAFGWVRNSACATPTTKANVRVDLAHGKNPASWAAPCR